VVVVVTQPDRERGRGRKRSPSPVARLAEARGVPVLRPERVGDPEVVEALRAHAPDLGVVVAFGQFLPRRIRELPRRGFLLNAHASLLPRHRGAAPIAHALLAGDTRTGVCAMRVDREMDAGPVCGRRETEIGPEETAGDLTERLAELAAGLMAETVDRAARGELEWEAQDPAGVTFAPRVERADARLDWREPACALARRVRAMAPKPGAFAVWEGAPLRILAARAEPAEVEDDAVEGGGAPPDPPGTVRLDASGAPRIATGRGWLAPTVLQRAGGRPLPVDAFQRGRGLPDGARLALPDDASDARAGGDSKTGGNADGAGGVTDRGGLG
jgi:methionyl-tRNA formyltransferase